MSIYAPLTQLKGVGPKREEKFRGVHIETILDLLYYFPRDYEDLRTPSSFSRGSFGDPLLVKGKIIGKRRIKTKLWKCSIVDREGTIGEVSFFASDFLYPKLEVGRAYYFYGDLGFFGNQVQLTNPKFYTEGQFPKIQGIQPIYPLAKGLKQFEIEKTLGLALESLGDLPEILPRPIREKYGLMDRKRAIYEMHRPTSFKDLSEARRRFIFEEFFLLQCSVFYRQGYDINLEGIPMKDQDLDPILQALPFDLTSGQARSLEEILDDLKKDKAMRRLLQGDVGSGKTMVAMLAMLFVVKNGYQTALMAPTEILASQHFQTMEDYYEKFDYKLALLTGKTSPKERKILLEDLAQGKIDTLLGTHALLEEDVEFANLGLVITDEQHRFGVDQRETFLNKGKAIHSLVMTATPIPRTYALANFGDLDLSMIDTLPPGRLPVQTKAIDKNHLQDALNFLRRELLKGHQAYVVTPLIEENESLNLEAAEKVYQDLQKEFADFSLALLHGQLSNQDKEEIMEAFNRGDIDLLVSTTVIEVGVNVPNANVMFIYNAQQFGLAQLHQLRGRVGRGKDQAYCILYNSSDTEKAWERMSIIESTRNGLKIAQKDLELRGAGDFFGTRQSGLSRFFLGDALKDQDLFQKAQKEAQVFFRRYPFSVVEKTPLGDAIKEVEALLSRT